MVALHEYERYYIAHDVLMVLTFIPCLVIFLCALCLARRRKDPARSAFTYLKVAFAFLTLLIFLDFCSYALALASALVHYDVSDEASSNILRGTAHAQYNIFTVAQTFEAITDILIFIMLLRLSTGILFIQTGKPGKFDKIFKFRSYSIASVLAIIAIVQFGLRIHFYNTVFAKTPLSTKSVTDQFNSSRQLDFSFRVLVFVLAIAIVAQSVIVKTKMRSELQVSSAANILVACAGLWLLRTVYGVASRASALNRSDIRYDPFYKGYFSILDIIFGIWPLLILLCLVFRLGSKKKNGLWSTEQPFMADTQSGDAMTPWGYSYDSQTMAPPVAHQQQQAPPVVQVPPPYYEKA
ncbi:hypothetical protein AUP68_16796 [Ilyonectria robusta]